MLPYILDLFKRQIVKFLLKYSINYWKFGTKLINSNKTLITRGFMVIYYVPKTIKIRNIIGTFSVPIGYSESMHDRSVFQSNEIT